MEEREQYTVASMNCLDNIRDIIKKKNDDGEQWDMEAWFEFRLAGQSFFAWVVFAGSMLMGMISIFHYYVSDGPKNVFLIGSIEKHHGIPG